MLSAIHAVVMCLSIHLSGRLQIMPHDRPGTLVFKLDVLLVSEFLLTSASCGPSAIAGLLVTLHKVNCINVLVVHVLVSYFLFLVSCCVLLVAITAVIQYLHRRGQSIFTVVMPDCVSKGIIIYSTIINILCTS